MARKVRPAYFKFWTTDWLKGTFNMSLEQRAMYVGVLCLQWEDQGPIKLDYVVISRRLGIGSSRVARRLIAEVAAHGPTKLTVQMGEVWNPSMQRRIDAYNKVLLRMVERGKASHGFEVIHGGGRAQRGFRFGPKPRRV
jgi:hypothetical protein